MFKNIVSKLGWIFLLLSIVSVLFSQVTLGEIVDSEIIEVKPWEFVSYQSKTFSLIQDGVVNFKINSVLPDTNQSLFEIKITDNNSNLKYKNSKRFARNLINLNNICRSDIKSGEIITRTCKNHVSDTDFADSLKLPKGDYYLSLNPKVITTETFPKEPFKINIEIRSESSDSYKFVFASVIFLFGAVVCWFLWVGKNNQDLKNSEVEENV
jgi:hypothetical protein